MSKCVKEHFSIEKSRKREQKQLKIIDTKLFKRNSEILKDTYLFGKVYESEHMKSIMPEGTPYFEVEELYVIPKRRSQGIGEALFRHVEDAVKNEAEYMVLSTATKNWKAIFHFYLDELDMQFWSARLFKRIGEKKK